MRLLGADALRHEPRVFLRFLPGSALMPQIVMGGEFANEIEEKPLHGSRTRPRTRRS
jgi:hypothetical protein